MKDRSLIHDENGSTWFTLDDEGSYLVPEVNGCELQLIQMERSANDPKWILGYLISLPVSVSPCIIRSFHQIRISVSLLCRFRFDASSSDLNPKFQWQLLHRIMTSLFALHVKLPKQDFLQQLGSCCLWHNFKLQILHCSADEMGNLKLSHSMASGFACLKFYVNK